jgi:hypothetical protein
MKTVHRAPLALFTLACCAAIPAAASAQELYRQNAINQVGGYAAQDARNPGGLGWFAEVVDNFTATDTWNVGSVEFWGGYVTDVPGNTEGFMIRFYQKTGDTTVGDLISTQDMTAFDEVEYYNTFIPGIGTVRGYHYTVALNSAVQLPAGEYWISVTAILGRGGTANEPQWGWITSSGFNNPSAMQRFFSPTFAPVGQDMSFVLNSATGGCDADFNGDNQVDFFDYLDFVAAFDAEDSSADFNGDNQVDFFDYLDFASSFDACQ